MKQSVKTKECHTIVALLHCCHRVGAFYSQRAFRKNLHMKNELKLKSNFKKWKDFFFEKRLPWFSLVLLTWQHILRDPSIFEKVFIWFLGQPVVWSEPNISQIEAWSYAIYAWYQEFDFDLIWFWFFFEFQTKKFKKFKKFKK
jgi:hypothetical protein